MRIFWGHSHPDLKKIDDGAFAKWLNSQVQHEESAVARAGPDQVVVIGHGFTPLPGSLHEQVSSKLSLEQGTSWIGSRHDCWPLSCASPSDRASWRLY